MDHLWLDHDMQLEPELVPYFDPGELKYDRNERNLWEDRFRAAFPPDSVKPNSDSTPDPRIVLQGCIFFGILTEFCAMFKIEFRRDDFVTTRDHKLVLTTSKLHLLSEDVLKARVRALQSTFLSESADSVSPMHETTGTEASDSDGEQALLRHFNHLIQVAREPNYCALREAAEDLLHAFSHLCGLMLETWLPYHEVPITFISCCVLLESLTRLTEFALGIHGPERIEIQLRAAGLLCGVVRRRCRYNRTCPRRVQSLMHSPLPVTQVYIATSIIGHKESNHDACVIGEFCQARQTQVMLPAHTQECEGACDVMLLTSKHKVELESSIEHVGYGLLKFESISLTDPTFNVCAPTADVQYVAFSHVWSHGLGNPQQNGLPACQLLRLKRIMQQADCSAHAFWLDSLCVPSESEWKLRAVEKMDVVYSEASKVIIVDRDLVRCRGSDILRRMCMRISDWITRIWTLQEAVLPGDNLYAAFADGVHHVNSIIESWWDWDGPTTRSVLVYTDPPFGLESMLCTTGTELIDLVINFHNRATTRSEDEATCLAILLGMDLRSLPHPFAVPDVLENLPSVAQDIVFAPGPRCTRAGYRWCPKSFMSSSERRTYSHPQISVQTGPKGLRMEKDVILIGSLESSIFTRDSNGMYSRYLVLLEDGMARITAYGGRHLEADGVALPSYLRDAALIFEYPSDFDDESSTSAAILVSDVRTQDGELCARYECILSAINFEVHGPGRPTAGRDGAVEVQAVRLRETIIWVD